MRILLYCPTYKIKSGELAMRNETQESITNLIIPDGVSVDVHVDAINPLPHDGDRKNRHENTLIKYRKARLEMLNGGYDALLTIEHDMIVPEDALEKMINTDADVVYGLYMFRHLKPIMNALRTTTGRYIDMSVSIFPEMIKKGKRQGWLKVSGAGFGCTLMHRRVLEKIDFHRTKNGDVPIPDMPFAEDCVQNGFIQICRFDVQCGHIKPDGTVLWPFDKEGDAMNKVKIYVLRTFNANIGGKQQHFEEGTETEIEKEEALDYVRAGYIGLVESKPAVKVVRQPNSKQKAVK